MSKKYNFSAARKEKNDSQGLKTDVSNLDDLQNKLSDPSEELPKEPLKTNSGSKENFCWFSQIRVPKMLYPI